MTEEQWLEAGIEHTPEMLAALVASGAGPQNFKIKKVTDLLLEFKLDDGGDFQLGDLGESFSDQLYAEYPAVEAAHADNRWLQTVGDPGETPLRRALTAQTRAAIQSERSRLLVSA